MRGGLVEGRQVRSITRSVSNRSWPAVSVALAVFAFCSAAPTHATCGAASCFLVTGTLEGVANEGHLMIDLSYRYIVQDRKLSGTRNIDEVLTPKVDFDNGVLEPGHHREIRTQNTLVQVDMAYGLTDRLTLVWLLPIVNDRDHEHFDEVGTPDEHFTRQDGSSGFGDIIIGARYGFLVRPRDLLVGGLSIKTPTGQYKLRNGEGEINEPSIQPGTGSTDMIGSFLYSHEIIPLKAEWFVSGSYRVNRENDLDYRFGDETQASAGFRYKTERQVTWSLQVNGRETVRDAFLGERVPSTGSTLIYVTPGLRLDNGGGTSIYGFVQVPAYKRVNEVNLAPRAGFVIGLSHLF